MTRCLIFGGNGFIGSNIAQALVERGYDVIVFDNFQTGMRNLESIKNKIEIVRGDFLNDSDIDGVFRDVDYVFHYISTTIPSTARHDPVYDIASNIIGSVKLFQSAANNHVKKIFLSSSGGMVYGEPLNLPARETDPVNPGDPYAISKMAIERYLRYFNHAYKLDYTILRYSNPFGKRQNPNGKQGVIPIFLNSIKKGKRPVIYGDGSMIRDYIYINDAVEATIAVLEKGTNEKIFNVGSGKGTRLNELIDIISGVVGKKIIPRYVDDNPYTIKQIVLDISKIQREIGWTPKTSLKEGIQKTWDWINRGAMID